MKRSPSVRRTGITIYFLNQAKTDGIIFHLTVYFLEFANTVLGWWPESKCLCKLLTDCGIVWKGRKSKDQGTRRSAMNNLFQNGKEK